MPPCTISTAPMFLPFKSLVSSLHSPLLQLRLASCFPLHESASPQHLKKAARQRENATRSEPISAVPIPLPPPRLQAGQGRRDEAGGHGGRRAPVAAALRALRAPPHRPPGVAGGRGGGAAAAAAAGDARRGGVHAAGRVHGADALRLGHLHARLLPHALGRRPRIPLPLRRLRHQPLRDLEGHPPLALRRVLRLGLAQGGVLPMAYIFQAFIHIDVKPTTKVKAPTEVSRRQGSLSRLFVVVVDLYFPSRTAFFTM